MSKLYSNLAAEKEADDIGRKFMNSSDVLSDMGKAYGRDLKSEITIHDDSEADTKVKSANRDAFASGNDIFFSKGALDGSAESNRLLGHEAAHVIQQSGGADGITQSANFGAAQGGFFWFSKTNLVATRSDVFRRPIYEKGGQYYVDKDGQRVPYNGGTQDKNDFELNKINYIYDDNAGKYGKTMDPVGELSTKDKVEAFFDVPSFAPQSREDGEKSGKKSLGSRMLAWLGRGLTSLPVIGEIAGGAIGAKNSQSGHKLKGFLHGMKRGAIARTIMGVGGTLVGLGRGIFGGIKMGLGKMLGKKKWVNSGREHGLKGVNMLGKGLMNTLIGGGTIAGTVLGPMGMAAGLGSAAAATGLGLIAAKTGIIGSGLAAGLGAIGGGTALAATGGATIAATSLLGAGLDLAKGGIDKKVGNAARRQAIDNFMDRKLENGNVALDDDDDDASPSHIFDGEGLALNEEQAKIVEEQKRNNKDDESEDGNEFL